MNQEKSDIRAAVRTSLRRLSAEEREAASAAVFGRIERTGMFRRASVVLLFWSLADEIPTHSVVQRWVAAKTVLLPVVAGDELLLRRYEGASSMRAGAFGILEPAGADFLDFEAIDIAVVPGVAFGADGSRMGRGRGFYDRLLPKLRAEKVGVCFDEQVFGSLPSEPWDVPMDVAVSPKGVFWDKNNRF